MTYKKDGRFLRASSKENKESEKPYYMEDFRFLIFTKILLDMFSFEDSRRNSP